MNYPMITWCVIAAVLLCAFIFRAVEFYCSTKKRNYNSGHKARHYVRYGRDTDIFYIPGDNEIPGIADREDESKGQ